MKMIIFVKSFAKKRFANLITNLSRMVLIIPTKLFYINSIHGVIQYSTSTNYLYRFVVEVANVSVAPHEDTS